MSETNIELRGKSLGTLTLRTLPEKEEWRGVPLLLVSQPEYSLNGVVQAEVQVLEETEYVYEFSGYLGNILVEPIELFDPSDSTGLKGRFRPQRAVGTVVVTVRSLEGDELASCELEVRSRKLDYLSEYRWMIQRIADEAAEAAQSQFAASMLGAFRPSSIGTSETLYQRFAFIQSLLASTDFVSSLSIILHRPHHEYRVIRRLIDPSKGIKTNSSLAKALARPGPRQRVSDNNFDTLPLSVEEESYEETFDSVPNRFVKHALVRWRYLARSVEDACRQRTGPTADRGRREANNLAQMLDEFLRAPLFLGVGSIDAFPAQNTVLQRRPGYRDVLRAYLQVEAAALVDWAGGTDAFKAGQRDVAALYEYWAFFELARIVDGTPGFVLDRRPLFRRSPDGMSLELRRGNPAVLRGKGARRNRSITIELWFNRQFRSDSWTEPMRPDCSLRITPESPHRIEIPKWLHFDAKYRIDWYRQILHEDTPDGGDEGETHNRRARPLSGDLLKMHAYRDAIRRTTGAFVLYPGFDEAPTHHTQYHEILPGLGAFVLRPTETGEAHPQASQMLRRFIEDAIDHLAALGTDEERAGYWTSRVYTELRGRRLPFQDWIRKPPADVTVLLSFVHGPSHLEWVERTGQYNLRADDRVGSVGLTSPELSAEILCIYDDTSHEVWLYRASGRFVLRTAEDLINDAYPTTPGGSLYCCILIDELLEPPEVLTGEVVRSAARVGRLEEEWAAPRICTLDELLHRSEEHR